MRQIVAAPDQWSPYLHNTRVFRLHRFPYLIVYRTRGSMIQVIAIAHGRRKPAYWKRRLP